MNCVSDNQAIKSAKRQVGELRFNSSKDVFIPCLLSWKSEIPVDFRLDDSSVVSQIDRVTAIQLGLKSHPRLVMSPLVGNTNRIDYLSKVDICIMGIRTPIMIRVNDGLLPALGADMTQIYDIRFDMSTNSFNVTEPHTHHGVTNVHGEGPVSFLFDDLSDYLEILPSDLHLFSNLPVHPTGEGGGIKEVEEYLYNITPLQFGNNAATHGLLSEAVLNTGSV